MVKTWMSFEVKAYDQFAEGVIQIPQWNQYDSSFDNAGDFLILEI